MMIVLQLVLYCLLYFLLVKAAAGNDGLRCLYFYPKEYQEEAFRRGLAEKETVARQSKRFMIPFCLVMLAALAASMTRPRSSRSGTALRTLRRPCGRPHSFSWS